MAKIDIKCCMCGESIEETHKLDPCGIWIASNIMEEEDKQEESPDGEVYKVKHFGGGRYNVLSPKDKKMSNEHLSKKEAKTLKASLDTPNE